MASANEIVRVTLHYTQPNAGDCQNVFHFQITGASPTDTDVLNTVNSWCINDWGPEWATLASASADLESFESDIVNVDGTVARNLGGMLLNISGAVAGESTSAAVSAYLLAYTVIPKARGSKYVPGMAEGNISSGAFIAPALAEMAILLAEYLLTKAIGTGGTLVPGVLSLTLGQFVPFLVAGAIDSLPAYQRRRKEGVGI